MAAISDSIWEKVEVAKDIDIFPIAAHSLQILLPPQLWAGVLLLLPYISYFVMFICTVCSIQDEFKFYNPQGKQGCLFPLKVREPAPHTCLTFHPLLLFSLSFLLLLLYIFFLPSFLLSHHKFPSPHTWSFQWVGSLLHHFPLQDLHLIYKWRKEGRRVNVILFPEPKVFVCIFISLE